MPPGYLAAKPDASIVEMANHLRAKYGIKGDEAMKMASSLTTGTYPEAQQMRAELAKTKPVVEPAPGRTTTPHRNEREAKDWADYGATQSMVAAAKQGALPAPVESQRAPEIQIDGSTMIRQPKPASYLGEMVGAGASQLQSMIKKKV